MKEGKLCVWCSQEFSHRSCGSQSQLSDAPERERKNRVLSRAASPEAPCCGADPAALRYLVWLSAACGQAACALELRVLVNELEKLEGNSSSVNSQSDTGIAEGDAKQSSSCLSPEGWKRVGGRGGYIWQELSVLCFCL